MNAAGKLAAILAADVAGYSRLGPLTAQPRRQGTPPNDRSPPKTGPSAGYQASDFIDKSFYLGSLNVLTHVQSFAKPA